METKELVARLNKAMELTAHLAEQITNIRKEFLVGDNQVEFVKTVIPGTKVDKEQTLRSLKEWAMSRGASPQEIYDSYDVMFQSKDIKSLTDEEVDMFVKFISDQFKDKQVNV